jgi:F-box-like
MLPDDVLVEIFDFYVNINDWRWLRNMWHALVHVCRRWRYLVFASPRRLNLRLEYHGHRPISEMLDTWPVLPVIIISSDPLYPTSDKGWHNTVAALESVHSNRICEIYIDDMTKSRWERFTAAMQKPFPELKTLAVFVRDVVPVLSDSFLGGSAPRLRQLRLGNVPFPSTPKLLSSANGLVTLSLWDIRGSGYISPDVMAAALTTMTRLESLRLEFRSLRSRPDPASRTLPPPIRFVLPALTKLEFKGVYEYLEDLLARIDVPRLYYLLIIFVMDLDFDLPQLHRLIDNAEAFKTFNRATVFISDDEIQLSLYPKTEKVGHHRQLELQIMCRELDGQLSSLAQVCGLSSSRISTLEELKITERDYLSPYHWKDDMENAQWLKLLNPFTAVKDLYLTDETAQHVCGALQELSGERATEVLPALRNLFILGFSESLQPIQDAMKLFVAARQLSGHPMVVDCWKPLGVTEAG